MGNCCCGDSAVGFHRSPSNNGTDPSSSPKEIQSKEICKKDDSEKSIPPPKDNGKEISKKDDSEKSISIPKGNGKEIAREHSGSNGTLPTPKSNGKEIARESSGSSSSNGTDKSPMVPNLRIYTYAELNSATKNFRPDSVLGEGGFGTVFKGWVDEKTYAPSRVGVGIPVAVKRANADSSQGLKEWKAEVNFLGKFKHPNLVKLLGFCWEDDKFLLVYEYMQKGSLENHLFRRGAEPLSWEIRLNIAIGAAKGLDHLHSSENKVIYRDFKTSNILLDGKYNSKLSDFGLAKLGPMDGDTHVSTTAMGTYGYAAPEYLASGHLYIKSDVYGFGVVMLEILTGQMAIDTNRPGGEQNLVEWARPYLNEKRKLKKIVDPNLEGRYPIKGAYQAAKLILKCLESEPKNRPSMEEVLQTLEKINSIDSKQKGAALSPLHQSQDHYRIGKSYNDKSPIKPKHGFANGDGRGYDLPSTSRSS